MNHPPEVKYDPYWFKSEKAENLLCQKQPFLWDQEAGRKLNAMAREACGMSCPFRVDCYMTSFMSGDNGVMRGGVMITGRIKCTTCAKCGLPAVKPNKTGRVLCPVCVRKWDCYGCERVFWTERSREPKNDKVYHSEQCRYDSLRKRVLMVRAEKLRAAA